MSEKPLFMTDANAHIGMASGIEVTLADDVEEIVHPARPQIGEADHVCLRIYPGETHSSVWPMAFTHGLRRLYPEKH